MTQITRKVCRTVGELREAIKDLPDHICCYADGVKVEVWKLDENVELNSYIEEKLAAERDGRKPDYRRLTLEGYSDSDWDAEEDDCD